MKTTARMRMRACKMQCLTSYLKKVNKTEEYITVAQKIWRHYNHSLSLDAIQSWHQKTVQSLVDMMIHQICAGNWFELPLANMVVKSHNNVLLYLMCSTFRVFYHAPTWTKDLLRQKQRNHCLIFTKVSHKGTEHLKCHPNPRFLNWVTVKNRSRGRLFHWNITFHPDIIQEAILSCRSAVDKTAEENILFIQ